MNVQGFNFFVTTLRNFLGDSVTQVTANWPTDQDRPKYPFICAIVASSVARRGMAGATFLAREGTDNRYYTGEWTTTLNLHFFFQTAEEQNRVVGQINSFFQTLQDKGKDITGEVDLKFGPEEWETITLRYNDFRLASGESGLRKGERRIIFEVFMDSVTSELVSGPVLKETKLDVKVAENRESLK